MIENPKNIIEAAESLDINATLTLLKAMPGAWRETIDGKTLIAVIISHLKKAPTSKRNAGDFYLAARCCHMTAGRSKDGSIAR
jgi:hypothetical protein